MGQAIRTVHRNSNQSTHRCLVSGVLALSMSPADVSPGDSADGATSIISGLQAAGANNAGPTSSWLSEIHRWISLNTIRSEEHTSELQSRFGISYAVFCLKK